MRYVFFTNSMKGSLQSILDITKHGIQSFKGGELGILSPTASDDRHMITSSICNCSEAVEPIRKNCAASTQTGSGISSDLRTLKTAEPTQLDLHWPAVLRRLNSCQERDFITRPSPTLSQFLTTNTGIIHLDATSQFF